MSLYFLNAVLTSPCYIYNISILYTLFHKSCQRRAGNTARFAPVIVAQAIKKTPLVMLILCFCAGGDVEKNQSSSSPDSSSSRFCSLRLRSLFLGLSSSFHSLFAASLSTLGKTMGKTSEYQLTGLPSMPSLIFCWLLVSRKTHN